MENGSIANQEIPNFVLLDDEVKRRPFHSRQPSHDLHRTDVLPPNPDLEFSYSVVDQIQDHQRSLLKMADNLEMQSKRTKSIFEMEKKSILCQMREPVVGSDFDNVLVEEAANNDTKLSANEAQTV
jgi:hypothetical protein